MVLAPLLVLALAITARGAAVAQPIDWDILFPVTKRQKASPASIGDIPQDAYGADLRALLKEQYSEHTDYTYDNARKILYGYVCNDEERNSLECLYSGSVLACDYATTSTSCTPTNSNLSAEHIVPKTYFNQARPPMSDMHHLRPTWKNVNSARNDYPFDWVPGQAGSWYRDYERVANSYPTEGETSEWSHYNAQKFEPRDKAKGVVSRAAAYIFTMYPEYLENISKAANFDTLMEWNTAHPPTEEEKTQNARILERQGNENPYVLDHTLFNRAFCDLLAIGCSEFGGPDANSCSPEVEATECTKCSSLSVCTACPAGYLFDKRVDGTVSCVSTTMCTLENNGEALPTENPMDCVRGCDNEELYGPGCTSCDTTGCLICDSGEDPYQGICGAKAECDTEISDTGCIECSDAYTCSTCAGTLLFDKRVDGKVGCISKSECSPANGGSPSEAERACQMDCTDSRFGDMCAQCTPEGCVACDDGSEPVSGKCEREVPIVCDPELEAAGCTSCISPTVCASCPEGSLFDKRASPVVSCIQSALCTGDQGGKVSSSDCVLDCSGSLFGDYCGTCTLDGCTECRGENGKLDTKLGTCTYVSPGTGCSPEVERTGCLLCSSANECIDCGPFLYDKRVEGTVSCILESQCQPTLAGQLFPAEVPTECLMNCSHSTFGSLCARCTAYGGCSECLNNTAVLDTRLHICRAPEAKKGPALMSADIFWIVVGSLALVAVLALSGWGIAIIVKRKIARSRDSAI